MSLTTTLPPVPAAILTHSRPSRDRRLTRTRYEKLSRAAIAPKRIQAHDPRRRADMAFTEEQSVRLAAVGGVTVDGVIRTRGIRIDREPVRLGAQERVPV